MCVNRFSIPKPNGLYRKCSATNQNLTPRPKDTNGISTAVTPPQGKPQIIDTSKLDKLEAIRDGVDHVSIRPKDMTRMQEWIDTRGTDTVHEFTDELRDALKGTENKK